MRDEPRNKRQREDETARSHERPVGRGAGCEVTVAGSAGVHRQRPPAAAGFFVARNPDTLRTRNERRTRGSRGEGPLPLLC